ncbi:putrescine transport system ATP-binding protein [Palleronia salina]|uniref:Spermidine/putrescine import ATP-binding protein PotA n=1 Tax=Palleronia salina TaxID=313368 RepID=A0A1M6LPJ4_9RHOB|nr:ABC transporter ATP-binding protein [Palleronia salina]SHJ73135.1 putrescine transport system ATP-binding protein [Palleronia salina]
MSNPFIRIDGVTRTFGEVYAVDDVSLDIQQGELFCLLGGSGSGKSTLLRMLAGFERPTTGRIIIDGRDMTDVPPHARDVNMMFQSYALFPHMSVERNIAYGLHRMGMPRAQIATRVTEMLSLVQMEKLARRKPDQLSGGQRQRVALARALARRPKLLLLDEPLGALDRKLREETQLELKKIQSSLGITFIVVTHDQEEAMTLGDRLGVMNEGRIVQVGAPHEVYEFPQSRFVADFIGTVNLFDGTIAEDRDTDAVIASPEAGIDIRIPHAVAGTAGQPVAVALRPEKIVISRTLPDPYDNVLTGQVTDIVYSGNLSVFHVTLASGKRVRVSRTNRLRAESEGIGAGDAVQLGFTGHSAVVLAS